MTPRVQPLWQLRAPGERRSTLELCCSSAGYVVRRDGRVYGGTLLSSLVREAVIALAAIMAAARPEDRL